MIEYLRYIKHLRNSRFVRNVFLVATGTAGAQAITLAFSPVITRLYGPEAFGLLGIFMALVTIVDPIAALTYPTAIVLPKEDSEARGIAWLSFITALVISILVAIVFLIFGNSLAILLNVSELGALIMLVPLVIIFSALVQISQQFLIRKKQFKIRARVDVLQALIVNSTKSLFGIFKPLGSLLVIIYTLGIALYATLMSFSAKKANIHLNENNSPLSTKSLLILAKKYNDFPLYRTPSITIQHFMASMPVLMLGGLFGPAAAGFYALGRRILNAPAQLIGNAVGDVFYPRIAEASNRGENLSKLILKATATLAAVGILPFGLIAATGPWLFGFVFGQEWVIAGEYARWLSLISFCNLIDGPVKKGILVMNLQFSFLVFNVCAAILRIGALACGALIFKSALTAVIFYSMVGGFSWLMLIPYVLFKSKVKWVEASIK